jgi:hypothetical protein
LRCVQTVQPLADKLDLHVELCPELGEGTAPDEVSPFLGTILSADAVVCSHGDMVPVILGVLACDHSLDVPEDYPCAKGSTWEIAVDGSDGMVARYLPPPT